MVLGRGWILCMKHSSFSQLGRLDGSHHEFAKPCTAKMPDSVRHNSGHIYALG